MSLFKRKREPVPNEMTAQKIAGAIVGSQKRIARFLNSRTGRLSAKTLFTALIIFCTAFGGYFLYLLVRAIS